MAPGMRLPTGIEGFGYLEPDKLVDFYNDCAVFVLPSRYEGWGLPAAEAMACGAALVTTINGGTEDFAEHGRTALLVQAGNSAAIAEAVVRLLNDDPLRLRLAAAAREKAETMDWDTATERLADILQVARDTDVSRVTSIESNTKALRPFPSKRKHTNSN